MNKIKDIVNKCLSQNPCEIDIRFNETMKNHTTFKVGGEADCWIKPSGDGFPDFCTGLLNETKKEGIPVFVLGGGANIVVSDKGIRGIVLDTKKWNGQIVNENEFVLRAGTTMDEACQITAASELSGLEFLSGMPGTIGGAVWMNARCYDNEMSDVLKRVEIIEKDLIKNNYTIKKIEIEEKHGFGYKLSPFQNMDCLILSTAFNLRKGNKQDIINKINKNKQDRIDKGHYLFPSAGSAFKNNREFGKPTGLIIDELGLKGFKIGDAQIAPFHGNIIINTGNATAANIRALTDEVANKVKKATGFELEPEILFVGQ
ncbi:MAG: UDP-N-acetylmuramate dehydrogenase [Treponema sp.]|nr:UDP-N-acetylmuramate dehydrogenase [Treponema sp.]